MPRRLASASAALRRLAEGLAAELPPKQKEALDRMPLSTEGEAGLQGAETLLRRHELRWRIERFFHALKQGARIGDRRLDHAGDLRKRIAFDAAAAFRVWDAAWLARNRPGEPACRHLERTDIDALMHLARSCGLKAPRGPPTVADFAALVGGLAGFRARHDETAGRPDHPEPLKPR